MSISGNMAVRLAQLDGDRLVRLPPLVPAPPPRRTVWVSEDVFYDVQPPFEDHYDGTRLLQFRGALDAFTNHYKVSVAEDPRSKPWDAFLARVDPVSEEIWDIRSLEPPQGIRCFGAFASLNEFVALTWDYRENISDFNSAVRECAAEWNALFGDIRPHSGGSLDAYLTNYHAV